MHRNSCHGYKTNGTVAKSNKGYVTAKNIKKYKHYMCGKCGWMYCTDTHRVAQRRELCKIDFDW
jgi:hypothetical protein